MTFFGAAAGTREIHGTDGKKKTTTKKAPAAKKATTTKKAPKTEVDVKVKA